MDYSLPFVKNTLDPHYSTRPFKYKRLSIVDYFVKQSSFIRTQRMLVCEQLGEDESVNDSEQPAAVADKKPKKSKKKHKTNDDGEQSSKRHQQKSLVLEKQSLQLIEG